MKILFLGDSVTDAHHSTSNDPLGCGYVSMVHNNLACIHHSLTVETINSGFNGHRSKDLLNRVDDLLDNNTFDYIFVLIGVNDSWRKFDHFDETTKEQYENNVDKLLNIIKNKSNAIVTLLSPFVLVVNELTQKIQDDLLPKQESFYNLSKKYNTQFIDLQNVLNNYAKVIPLLELAKDGIHPTILGHSLIATEVVKLIESNL